MSASLVGSEMCIRDSPTRGLGAPTIDPRRALCPRAEEAERHGSARLGDCLLYTSDAADDM
eukprot:12819193-Alexandrium_andersonii.AAC.1